jgi:hypothetical protein
MRRLALYVGFKYAGAAGIFLAFLWRLKYPSPLGMAWLPVAAGIHLVLLRAVCPPALRPRGRQSPGRLVTWRGIVGIVGMFAFILGGWLVLTELYRAGIITIPLQPEAQVISLRLVAGLLMIVCVLSAADFAAKKEELDHANDTDA